MPDELWTEVRNIVQETGIKTIPKEKKCKKAKWLSGEVLQIAVKRRKVRQVWDKNCVILRLSFVIRYDLNKIPYDYTVEVRNRFKGLDLIDRVPDEL